MAIRTELPGDEVAISTVITAAFRDAKHGGGNEAKVVETLREARSLTVSLVATENYVSFPPIADIIL
jgi:predicted N-acetyltransferase YhbS